MSKIYTALDQREGTKKQQEFVYEWMGIGLPSTGELSRHDSGTVHFPLNSGWKKSHKHFPEQEPGLRVK